MKKFAGSIFLLGALSMAGQVANAQLNVTAKLRHERVMLPAATPDRSRMDRGLLDSDDPSIDGILVTIAVGTML